MAKRTDAAHKVAELILAARGTPTPKNFTSAVILAAGSSKRMGGDIAKQFIEIDGIPAVALTLMAFDKAECIDEIVLVTRENEEDVYSALVQKYSIKTPLRAVVGGDERQESARIGSDTVSDKCKFICIHDAARCLITPEAINKVCHMAYLHKCAALAIRATDTVKIVDKNVFIESTPERNFTWQAQTPQVFSLNVYRAAAYIARDEGFTATDDCMLAEHIRVPVKLVESSRENLKITEPCDILFAEAVLKARKEAASKEAEEK